MIDELNLHKDFKIPVHGIEEGEHDKIYSIALSPSEDYLAVLTRSHRILVRDLEKKKWIVLDYDKRGKSYEKICFLDDARILVAEDGFNPPSRFFIYDIETLKLIETIKLDREQHYRDVQVLPGGKFFFVGSRILGGYLVSIWDTKTLKEIHRFKAEEVEKDVFGSRGRMAFCPEGKTLYTSGSDGKFKAWSVEKLLDVKSEDK